METRTWNTPECPFTIEYSVRVLDDIRLAVVDAFFSLPKGGAEIGGVLLGRREDGRIVITDSRPLDCEHAFGPSFNLSPRDLEKLAELISSSRDTRGVQAVGWYHSHTRSELMFPDADQDIHRKFFPEHWQVALVLKPHTFQPTRAGFFFVEPGGVIHGNASYQEFTLDSLPVQQVPAAPPVGGPSMVGPSMGSLLRAHQTGFFDEGGRSSVMTLEAVAEVVAEEVPQIAAQAPVHFEEQAPVEVAAAPVEWAVPERPAPAVEELPDLPAEWRLPLPESLVEESPETGIEAPALEAPLPQEPVAVETVVAAETAVVEALTSVEELVVAEEPADVENLAAEVPAVVEVVPVEEPLEAAVVSAEPVVGTVAEEVLVFEAPVVPVSVEEPVIEAPVIERPVIEEPVIAEPEFAAAALAREAPVTQPSVVEQPAPPPMPVAPPHFLTEGAPVSGRRWPAVAMVVVGLGVGVGAFQTSARWLPAVQQLWSKPQPAAPAVPVGLATEDRDGQLQIRWNPKSTAVLAAERATVTVQDGAVPQDIVLNRAELGAGLLTYSRQSERVAVTLRLALPNKPEAREQSLFVGKLPRQAEPAPAPVVEDTGLRQERDDLLKQTAKLKTDLAAQVARTKRTERALEDARKQLAQRRRLENMAPAR